eukprot:2776972-Prymnesium_polylepis.1
MHRVSRIAEHALRIAHVYCACVMWCHIGTPGRRESPTGCRGEECNHQLKRPDNRPESTRRS